MLTETKPLLVSDFLKSLFFGETFCAVEDELLRYSKEIKNLSVALGLSLSVLTHLTELRQ